MNNVRIKTIKSWEGPYKWLNTRYPSPVYHGSELFPTLAHAFEGSKTYNVMTKREIARMSLNELDELMITPRADWHAPTVMKDLLEIKFGVNGLNSGQIDMQMYLFKKLAVTGSINLIYGNNRHDIYWGICYCGERDSCKGLDGKNLLGHTMTQVRDQVHNRLDMLTPTKKNCGCGNNASRRILYSVGRIPRIELICSDPICVNREISKARKDTSDGMIVDYNPEGFSNLTYLPAAKEKKEEVATVKTKQDSDDMTDEELAEYYGYGYGEAGMWMGMARGNTTTTYSSSVIDREYKTTVIKC